MFEHHKAVHVVWPHQTISWIGNKKQNKKGDNWYILFVFVWKFEYRSQLDQLSCTMESCHPHPTSTTRHPHWLSSPPLLPISEVVHNMITINLLFCIKITTDR